jgi:hypothetical protein
MRRQWAALFVLLVTFLFAGCGVVQIGRINADPSRYRNRVVEVRGTVSNSMGVMGTGGYQLEDETGKIYVLSRTGVPAKGARVQVKGTVTPGAQVLGTTYGTAILESSHKIR